MKILFVNYTMNIGGIESFLLEISKEIKKSGKEVDILCYKNEKFDMETELKNNNINIYRIDNPQNIPVFSHINQLYKFIKKNQYDVVHSNTYTDSGCVMLASFFAGTHIRVTHSHTSQQPRTLLQKTKWFLAKILIKIFANQKIACSEIAGESLFLDKQYEILENGVDLTKYEYNSNIREIIRKKYNIKNNEIVMGHVGRFVPLKNHEFIIKVFELLKPNYKLMLIGDGPELNRIKDIVNEKKLSKRIIFTGNIRNTFDYLNAIDFIFFPSLYEGLPVSLIEAQINGLQIISSKNVSSEVDLFGNVHFFDLNEEKEKIVKMIENNDIKRSLNHNYFKKSNYNIENTAKKLLNIYNHQK